MVALGATLVAALIYAFAWPTVSVGRASFLTIAAIAAFIVGALAWWWAFGSLAISGQAGPGGKSDEESFRELQLRFVVALVGAGVAEFAVCAVTHLLWEEVACLLTGCWTRTHKGVRALGAPIPCAQVNAGLRARRQQCRILPPFQTSSLS